MKKKMLVLIGLMLICTGCGNAGYKSEATIEKQNGDFEYFEDVDENQENAGLGVSYSVNSNSADGYYETEEFADEAVTEAAATAEKGSNGSSDLQAKEETSEKLNKEMLVYRGELSIDTLDFEKSVSDFKALIDEKKGFIETESYTDNYNRNSYYAIDKEYKHNVYSATVRVPSSEYDIVMNSGTNLGDVRNRYSNASNVTQQYGTYKSQLEIYETQYDRYLALLKDATEDEYALQIENELFDIQVQIADLKSGITNIENDVSYSYIDITIKEVSKYEEEPTVKDTFFDRLKNTCKNSWEDFLDFLEDIVFYIIMNIYYIVIIVVVVIVIWRLFRKKRGIKKNKKDRKSKVLKEEVQNHPDAVIEKQDEQENQ